MKKALAFLLTVILAVTPVLAMASAAYTPVSYTHLTLPTKLEV